MKYQITLSGVLIVLQSVFKSLYVIRADRLSDDSQFWVALNDLLLAICYPCANVKQRQRQTVLYGWTIDRSKFYLQQLKYLHRNFLKLFNSATFFLVLFRITMSSVILGRRNFIFGNDTFIQKGYFINYLAVLYIMM